MISPRTALVSLVLLSLSCGPQVEGGMAEAGEVEAETREIEVVEDDCSTPYVEFDAPSAARVWVEVADDPEMRRVGLMHRERLAEDGGMLFVFDRRTRAAFWMKDTLIPLSIAFIDEDGTVLDIQDMEPGTLETHAPSTEYLYALETNVGWFAEHGVGPGDRARLCLE